MKKIKSAALLTLIVLISISLTSGLKLSASTGGNGGSSALGMTYGQETIDTIDQDIKLNADEGTISNHAYGTGSLPSNSLSRSDAKGNYVSVSRSISGKSGTTTWNYDWDTYLPISTIGSGVGAWLSLTASNAYSIYGKGYASNSQGDAANSYTSVGSSYPYTTSSLINYYANPTAFTNGVRVSQKADSANSYSIISDNAASNKEGDYSNAKTTLSSPVSGQASLRTFSNWATTDLGYVEAHQESYKASAYGDRGTLRFFSSSGNAQGDFSDVGTYPDIGEISGLSQTAYAQKYSADSSGKFSKVVSNYLNTWSWASNKEGDVSYTQAFVNRNRLFQNYAATATTRRTLVSSNMKAGYIGTSAGGSIQLWDKSYNLAGDWTQALTKIEPTLGSPLATASAWSIDESSQTSKSYSGTSIKSLSASSNSGNLFQELYGKNAFKDYSWSRIDYPKGGSIYSIPYKSTGWAAADAHSDYSRYTDAHLSDRHAGGYPNWAYAEAYNAYLNQYKKYYYPNYKYNCWSVDAYTSGTRSWNAIVTPLG